MNIHEHQAKDLLKEFGAPVPKGVVIYDIGVISQTIKTLKTKDLVVKAQIHAGGRGTAQAALPKGRSLCRQPAARLLYFQVVASVVS